MNKINKNIIDKGTYHKIYPMLNNYDKVIKTVSNSHKIDTKWVDTFIKYPDMFPIIYKSTDNYVILERLDTDKVKNELKIMEDDILINYPLLSDDIDDGYNISVLLYNFILNDKKQLIHLLSRIKNKLLFTIWTNYLQKLIKLNIRKFIDINDNNFGYDKKGNLKMLDI